MQNWVSTRIATVIAVLLLNGMVFCNGQADSGNLPPAVSIIWPRAGDSFRDLASIKIKANATDLDGVIAEVQFFAETNLIGTVTNPPYNLIWQVGYGIPIEFPAGSWHLKAVAVDDTGSRTESVPIRIRYHTGAPTQPVVQIVSPQDRALFAAPATFAFSAEVLASEGDAGPVEFFLNEHSLGLVDDGALLTATNPPSSVTVSNLAEGEYRLNVQYGGGNGTYCTCRGITNIVRVVALGVKLPRLGSDGRFQFEVVTSFPGIETIVEASLNLRDWIPISTNSPAGSAFLFTDSTPASETRRFYQVRLGSR